MLNISDAIELYLLLSKFIPDEFVDILDFIGKIIGNIKDSDRPEAFGEAIMLMHKLDIDDIKDKKPQETIELFVEGLNENKIMTLFSFCKQLGISDG